jgi:hypothetical protein
LESSETQVLLSSSEKILASLAGKTIVYPGQFRAGAKFAIHKANDSMGLLRLLLAVSVVLMHTRGCFGFRPLGAGTPSACRAVRRWG